MYENYKKARDAAWKMLIKYRVGKLPVNITEICVGEGFILLPYTRVSDKLSMLGLSEHAKKTDGFSMLANRHLLLFYDDTKDWRRQRFTIAHELGHYLNGDLSEKPTARNTEPSDSDDPRETSANMTACRILAPACVLWHMNITDARGIARLCDISYSAAKWRAERLKTLMARDAKYRELYGHGCFLMSPLERAVYKQFFGEK